MQRGTKVVCKFSNLYVHADMLKMRNGGSISIFIFVSGVIHSKRDKRREP